LRLQLGNAGIAPGQRRGPPDPPAAGGGEPPVMPMQIAWPAARLIPVKLRAFIGTAVELCDWRLG